MTPLNQISVLVCDDTAAKRYVISSWLRRDGYLVLEAETGARALEIAAGGVDIAVLDVHLPDMSGLEVCAAIKSNATTASVPVVHISAVAVEVSDRSAGLENGADAYLVDPIEPREMLSTVRSLLRSSSARRDAERLATRLDRLTSASLRVNVALTASRICYAASEGAARMVEAEAVVVLRDPPGVGLVTRTASEGLSVTSEVDVALLQRLLGAGPESQVVHGTDEPWTGVLSGSYKGPWIVTPIVSTDDVAGLVAVPAYAVPYDDDRILLDRLCQLVAVALDNLRVFVEEHRTALMLQRTLLPASLPSLPGMAIAARYRASDEQAEIGGDFFDAFTTDEGDGVVVIGDVQGHSLEAAVVMAELRYALRTLVHEGYPPDRVLARLDATLARSHPDLTATVCILVLPPHGRSMLVSNAGHIPPLVAADGQAAFLDYGGPLLGADCPAAAPVVVPLPYGHRVVLMTDGLIERRSGDMSEAMTQIAAEVGGAEADLTVEQLCDQLMKQWGGHGADDVCLIVLERVP